MTGETMATLAIVVCRLATLHLMSLAKHKAPYGQIPTGERLMQYDDGCETFHSSDLDYSGMPIEDVLMGGWYWWSCQPGCLPDGEPNGPFETEEDARNDYLYD